MASSSKSNPVDAELAHLSVEDLLRRLRASGSGADYDAAARVIAERERLLRAELDAARAEGIVAGADRRLQAAADGIHALRSKLAAPLVVEAAARRRVEPQDLDAADALMRDALAAVDALRTMGPAAPGVDPARHGDVVATDGEEDTVMEIAPPAPASVLAGRRRGGTGRRGRARAAAPSPARQQQDEELITAQGLEQMEMEGFLRRNPGRAAKTVSTKKRGRPRKVQPTAAPAEQNSGFRCWLQVEELPASSSATPVIIEDSPPPVSPVVADEAVLPSIVEGPPLLLESCTKERKWNKRSLFTEWWLNGGEEEFRASKINGDPTVAADVQQPPSLLRPVSLINGEGSTPAKPIVVDAPVSTMASLDPQLVGDSSNHLPRPVSLVNGQGSTPGLSIVVDVPASTMALLDKPMVGDSLNQQEMQKLLATTSEANDLLKCSFTRDDGDITMTEKLDYLPETHGHVHLPLSLGATSRGDSRVAAMAIAYRSPSLPLGAQLSPPLVGGSKHQDIQLLKKKVSFELSNVLKYSFTADQEDTTMVEKGDASLQSHKHVHLPSSSEATSRGDSPEPLAAIAYRSPSTPHVTRLSPPLVGGSKHQDIQLLEKKVSFESSNVPKYSYMAEEEDAKMVEKGDASLQSHMHVHLPSSSEATSRGDSPIASAAIASTPHVTRLSPPLVGGSKHQDRKLPKKMLSLDQSSTEAKFSYATNEDATTVEREDATSVEKEDPWLPSHMHVQQPWSSDQIPVECLILPLTAVIGFHNKMTNFAKDDPVLKRGRSARASHELPLSSSLLNFCSDPSKESYTICGVTDGCSGNGTSTRNVSVKCSSVISDTKARSEESVIGQNNHPWLKGKFQCFGSSSNSLTPSIYKRRSSRLSRALGGTDKMNTSMMVESSSRYGIKEVRGDIYSTELTQIAEGRITNKEASCEEKRMQTFSPINILSMLGEELCNHGNGNSELLQKLVKEWPDKEGEGASKEGLSVNSIKYSSGAKEDEAMFEHQMCNDKSTSSQANIESGILPVIITSKWESDEHMIPTFVGNSELCMQAICALYRQKKLITELTKEGQNSSTGLNINQAYRATKLAEFLLDGDHNGMLNKTIHDLKNHDATGPSFLEDLAIRCSKQLFDIYMNKEDPYFY